MVSKAEKGEPYGPMDGCFNLIVVFVLAVVGVIALVSCGGEEEYVPTPPSLLENVPETPAGGQSDPEKEFIREYRGFTGFIDASDDEVITLGHNICDRLFDEGVEFVDAKLTETIGAQNSAFVAGLAVRTMCPAYEQDIVDHYILVE